MYGLGAISLSSDALNKLAIAQRKMLRNLIGWDRRNDEAWEDTMRRMKIKLDRALKIQQIQLWADTVIKRKWTWHIKF